jgi:hypothetical protein
LTATCARQLQISTSFATAQPPRAATFHTEREEKKITKSGLAPPMI